MSGMISERSANRGSCAQSCRKDYVLTDARSGETLDSGYLISAKDLGAHEHCRRSPTRASAASRSKAARRSPSTSRRSRSSYRAFLDRSREGETAPASAEEVQPLVQIFSRGFTGGHVRRPRGTRVHHAHAARQPRRRSWDSRRRGRRRDHRRGPTAASCRRRARLRAARRIGARTIGRILGDARAHVSHARRHHAAGDRDARSACPRDGAWCARRSRALLERGAGELRRRCRARVRARCTRLDVRAVRRAGGPLKAVFSRPVTR